MRFGKRLAGLLAGLFLVPGMVLAQQQSSPAQATGMTHLRVDLVLAEYSGDKKISSLPYTMYVGVKDYQHPAGEESLRMGVRVPIAQNAQSTQFTYEHIGTDIDCHAQSQSDGRYEISGQVNRTSIYTSNTENGSADQEQVSGGHPILRTFNSGFDLALRDGETGEGISATDPFNGHVLKVSVTIHVVK